MVEVGFFLKNSGVPPFTSPGTRLPQSLQSCIYLGLAPNSSECTPKRLQGRLADSAPFAYSAAETRLRPPDQLRFGASNCAARSVPAHHSCQLSEPTSSVATLVCGDSAPATRRPLQFPRTALGVAAPIVTDSSVETVCFVCGDSAPGTPGPPVAFPSECGVAAPITPGLIG